MILFRTGKTIFLILGIISGFCDHGSSSGKKTAVVRLIGAGRNV